METLHDIALPLIVLLVAAGLLTLIVEATEKKTDRKKNKNKKRKTELIKP
ncbi:hypothetical protein ACFQ4C_12555 [Larkinella insperata]|uniref:Uncharacterized protein n=1 Tax=Larkinella insperata TaxID=332158 RepID=A0ABW3Q7N2_9BACT|nr:hypothetical protein [Larkinella insperata]